MMKKTETFDEFLLRHGYETPGLDMAELMHWHCSFVHENGGNHRRSIMRMKKVIEAYKELGRKEVIDEIKFIDIGPTEGISCVHELRDMIVNSLKIPKEYLNNTDDD
jgi:hypothetical protein